MCYQPLLQSFSLVFPLSVFLCYREFQLEWSRLTDIQQLQEHWTWTQPINLCLMVSYILANVYTKPC